MTKVTIVLPDAIKWQAALHEAGHAVIALALNIPVLKVSIASGFELDLPIPAGLSVGDVIDTPAGLELTFGRTRALAAPAHTLDLVIMKFAGLLAEKRLALSLADVLKMSSSDVDEIRTMVEEYELTGEVIDCCFYQAFAILAANWAAVEQIAEELMNRGSIDGSALVMVRKGEAKYPSLTSRYSEAVASAAPA